MFKKKKAVITTGYKFEIFIYFVPVVYYTFYKNNFMKMQLVKYGFHNYLF